jgi:predicted transcriptional regulator
MDRFTAQYQITHVRQLVEHSKGGPSPQGGANAAIMPKEEGEENFVDEENSRLQHEIQRGLRELRAAREDLLKMSHEVEEKLVEQLEELKQKESKTLNKAKHKKR